MNRILRMMLLALAVCLCASAVALAQAQAPPAKPVPPPPAPVLPAPPLPRLKVALIKTAPTIDGVLDDACWKETGHDDMTKLKNGQEAKSRTRIYVARDEKTLYVAVECFEDAEGLKNLTAVVTQHDGMGIWDDDCVELFIDPSGERRSYYQFIITSKNVTWDSYHDMAGLIGNPSWDPQVKTAVKVGDKSWVAEMAFPFSCFEQDSTSETEWAFNVTRNRPSAKENSYWSPTMSESSHNPDRFGVLTNMPKTNLFTAGENPTPLPPPKPPAPPQAMLFDFEDPAEAQGWSMLKLPEAKKDEPAVKVKPSAEHATSGKQSLKITFDGGEWPAVATTALKLPENVFDYQTIKLDVTASRPCLVAVRILQEKSLDGLGWDAGVTRWNAAWSLKPGLNEITRKLPGRADWEAVSPKFGKITTLAVMMYHPRKGESIWVDNIRLSSENVWPRLTTFKVLGTDLVVSGVEELSAKLNGEWKPPEEKPAAQVEAEFRARFDEMKKTHPAAVLAIFRQGEPGFDPRNPAKTFDGWADTHINSHSPDGPNPERTQVAGERDPVETFMRHRSSLMRVDTSSIPAGSNILAATLLIQGVDETKSEDQSTRESADASKANMWVAEACNRPWVEGEANAYEYAKDKFWRWTGGMDWEGDDPDFLPLFLAHGPAQGPVCWWDFTDAVKFWTGGAPANRGFMLHGTGAPHMRTYSKECKDAKLRPALMVVYEPR